MKIKKITIEFSPDPKDITVHGKIATFENGMWSADGPLYSRIHSVLHEVWKLLRQVVDNNGDIVK